MSDIDSNNIRRVDGGLLLVFRGLLRRGRTTTVAEELGLSQSAVSHALTRLRDLFGDPLFIRRPHGLEPTQRARELGPRIDALLDRLGETFQRQDTFNPATSERRFTISAPEFITAMIGADLVSIFRKQAPRAQFVIHYQAPSLALGALRRGEIDVALGRFGLLPTEFEIETVYQDHYSVAARKGHPQIKGRITQNQYNTIGHVFAHSESETGAEEAVEFATPRIACHAAVPGWLTVLTVVAASDAIATVPRKLVARQAKLLGLQVVNTPFRPMSIEVSAIRRSGDQDAGIDWLMSRIRDAIERR